MSIYRMSHALAAFALISLISGMAHGKTTDAIEPDGRLASGLQRAASSAYAPSLNELWIRLDFDRRTVRFREVVDFGEKVQRVQVDLISMQTRDAVISESLDPAQALGRDTVLTVPPLEGEYCLRFTFHTDAEAYWIEQELIREKFEWENNQLGISSEVPRPFEPVKVDDRKVSVVLRDYVMNDFGLIDSITADGRDLLAAPMRLRYELADGSDGSWEAQDLKLIEHVDQHAMFHARIDAPAIQVHSRISVEYDGVVKVEATLAPGSDPQAIGRLWVDIPMRDAEMPLMHTFADTMRINPAGYAPKGEGVIWTGDDAPRLLTWLNAFCSYIWLGREGTGLAWFGENDLGYLTEKNGSKKPIQELRREGDTLTLRVYLINHESTIREPTTLVFGLQATPTKPMPEDWRTIEAPSMSGPVVPWGGICCACKFPYKDDWSVVDKILEARQTGVHDKAWFEQWVKDNDPPLIFGRRDWLHFNNLFAMRAAEADGRPLLVYHEEMTASTLRPEWASFAGEWGIDQYPDRRITDESVMRRGFDTVPNSRVVYPDSYIDYAVYYANEWLKRGVGLYWDNTYPVATRNTRGSAAYEVDGEVQPAIVIWQQRVYHQRIWHLLTYWQDHQDQPLQWSNHTTNTMIAPLHTYGTTFLDLEWGKTEPFEPAFLRTESNGLQVGCIPYVHHRIYGNHNPHVVDLPTEQRDRIEWGMRVVHEIRVQPPLSERAQARMPDGTPVLDAFGYGSDAVRVHPYWADEPVVTLQDDNVYWLLLEREDQAIMLILSSWSHDDVQSTVRVNTDAMGIPATGSFIDVETGKPLAMTQTGEVVVDLHGPYSSRVITLGEWPPYEGEINRSGFIRWPSAERGVP